jgi:putative transposase
MPTPEQEIVLRRHCAHARFVWNLAVEQESWWRPGRGRAPGYLVQAGQLTVARAANPWLAAGSHVVQQQALRDFSQAMANFFAGTHGKPTWRKAAKNEGFRMVAVRADHIRRLSRHSGEVRVPKVGWVRFRWSRAVPAAKSYRVTLDRAGRWHIAFAVIPVGLPGPGTGNVVGVDRGIAVSAALSTGELLRCPTLHETERARLRRLERKLARARRGSVRRGQVKIAIAKLKAREADRRKDWAEKTSTRLARQFDIVRIENLSILSMTRSARGTIEQPGRNVRQKAGLNRGIRSSGWGLLARRLDEKAVGRVEKVDPAYTSQRCSACGTVDPKARKSQAAFACQSCGYADNADVNAAKNIAAGHAVTARGRPPLGRMNREPQHLAS